MNERPMRRLGIRRRQLFEALERPALESLPVTEYVYAEWRLARVGLDYHVEIESFFDSVPHALIREQVDVCITARTIEIFHRGKRVAAHARRYGGRRHGTDPEHMPSAHRRYAEWTPERFQHWGRTIGPSTEGLIIAILAPPAAPRTRLPHLPRRHAVAARRRSGTRRKGRLSSGRGRRAQLQEHRLDPRRGHSDRARQHPRPTLFPLRRG